MRGLPANNVLLYGDRGTGKSATVKAILNEYAPRGLRLVELPRPYLSDLAEVLALLRDRPQRFIVFVDDLSFEEQETDYKQLKALLEGSVEARPDNVLVYATSNRRHLVRERFSDRAESQDELRREDTVQEKLSLADRFGLCRLPLARPGPLPGNRGGAGPPGRVADAPGRYCARRPCAGSCGTTAARPVPPGSLSTTWWAGRGWAMPPFRRRWAPGRAGGAPAGVLSARPPHRRPGPAASARPRCARPLPAGSPRA